MKTTVQCLFCGKIIQGSNENRLFGCDICKKCKKDFLKIGIHRITIIRKKSKKKGENYENEEMSCMP